uniref:Uncharacterized protein n=1 Tax=Arundo donax TaxID=35708 RepID=A0A0A8Z767_ARUDO
MLRMYMGYLCSLFLKQYFSRSCLSLTLIKLR